MQVDAQPLAEAQFARRRHLWWHHAGVEERQPRTQRVEFGVVAVGVADFGDIAGGPVGHENVP